MHGLLEAIPQWFLCNEIINSHLELRWTFSIPLLYGKSCSFSLKLGTNPQFSDSESDAEAMQLPMVTHHYGSKQFEKFYPLSPSQKSSLFTITALHSFKYPCPSVPKNIFSQYHQQWCQHRPQEQNQQGRKSSLKIGYCSGWEAGCPSPHLMSLSIKSLLDKQIGIVLTIQEMGTGIAPI